MGECLKFSAQAALKFDILKTSFWNETLQIYTQNLSHIKIFNRFLGDVSEFAKMINYFELQLFK